MSCSCKSSEQQNKIVPTLEEHHAEDINVSLSEEGREMGKQRCTISYSVWDELGSLWDSLEAFKVCKPTKY